jgi:hypothetical protein
MSNISPGTYSAVSQTTGNVTQNAYGYIGTQQPRTDHNTMEHTANIQRENYRYYDQHGSIQDCCKDVIASPDEPWGYEGRWHKEPPVPLGQMTPLNSSVPVAESSTASSNLTVPTREKRSHSHRSSGSSGGSSVHRSKKKTKQGWDEDDFFDFSNLAEESPTNQSVAHGSPASHVPTHYSPAPGPSEDPSHQSHSGEMGPARESWDSFYSQNFYSDPAAWQLPRSGSPLLKGKSPAKSRSSSYASTSAASAEWNRIDRPEVAQAFSILELYDEPHADEARITKMARLLVKEYHPDRVAPESRTLAEQMTKNINHSRNLAIAFVRGEQVDAGRSNFDPPPDPEQEKKRYEDPNQYD